MASVTNTIVFASVVGSCTKYDPSSRHDHLKLMQSLSVESCALLPRCLSGTDSRNGRGAAVKRRSSNRCEQTLQFIEPRVQVDPPILLRRQRLRGVVLTRPKLLLLCGVTSGSFRNRNSDARHHDNGLPRRSRMPRFAMEPVRTIPGALIALVGTHLPVMLIALISAFAGTWT